MHGARTTSQGLLPSIKSCFRSAGGHILPAPRSAVITRSLGSTPKPLVAEVAELLGRSTCRAAASSRGPARLRSRAPKESGKTSPSTARLPRYSGLHCTVSLRQSRFPQIRSSGQERSCPLNHLNFDQSPPDSCGIPAACVGDYHDPRDFESVRRENDQRRPVNEGLRLSSSAITCRFRPLPPADDFRCPFLFPL